MCDDNNTSTHDGGHRMTWRGAIGAGAAGGVALLFAGRGPYLVEEKLNRSDVRTNTSDGAVQAGTDAAGNTKSYNRTVHIHSARE